MNRLLLLLPLITFFSCKQNEKSSGGLSPADALSTFQLADGFQIEQIVAEPLIESPVAMEVDENGNMYVVEMPGYPLDTAGTGKIKLLTDTDGDGAPDKSIVFADHLRLPTGVMRWKKGILVVDTPDIIYLEDSDNNGKADIRKIMLTGMALTNPQHIANTPVYGLDNWIYLAHMGTVTPTVSMEFSDSGSIVRYTDNPNAKTLPRNADGRNIRFRPDSYQIEMLSGASQYGQTFDNYGHHFGVENANHIFYEAIAARYLNRNADLLVENASDNISDHGNAANVYPITINPENQLLTDRGVITSACGLTWYSGGLFPDSFNNVTFVAEPVSNIVHADLINENGASFTASRLFEKKEFLASTDGWFRPVYFYIGPDGALYVIDYYRQIIEHPEWMSDEVNNSGALYNGADKGRIYRISPKGTAKMNWSNKLSFATATTADLIHALSSDNSWWRRTAQRLLVDRKENNAVPLLKQFTDTTHAALGFLHALWTMEGLHAIDTTLLKKALQHADAGVRESAIQIAELHLTDFSFLQTELLTLRNDPAAKVRYQLLCTIGEINTNESKTDQQEILLKDIEDKWVQIAALSSANGNELSLLQKSLDKFQGSPSEGKELFFSNCAGVIASSKRVDEIRKVIQLATKGSSPPDAWWQAACLNGLAKSIAKNTIQAGFEKEYSLLLSKFSDNVKPVLRDAAINLLASFDKYKSEALNSVLQKAFAVAADTNANKEYRADALKLLALNKNESNKALFEKIISSDAEEEAVQREALRAYDNLDETGAAGLMVKNWKYFSADLRESATWILLSSNGKVKILLNAIKDKTIQTTSISWPAKVQLMQNDDEHTRKFARELLASELGSREEAYKKLEPAITAKGDAKKGAIIFENVCGICHQYSSQHGKSFGPDLGSISNRDKASIMTDILNPNRSIAVKYDLWIVTKKNGERLSGIITAETPAAITLNQSGTQLNTIARSEIKNMHTSDASAMPVGLESSLTVEQMADLLTFLTNGK